MQVNKEIRVSGLRRSGNHAIINWIVQQHNNEYIFINNVQPYQDPFDFTKQKKRNTSLFVYSYEDVPVSYIYNPKYMNDKKCRYDIIHQDIYNVLIIRNPLNLFASRLKSDKIGVGSKIYNDKDLWIMYAQEYLGFTNFINSDKILINYDKWFIDVKYRKIIANQLGLKFTDKGMDDVPQFGGGSSFDDLNFDNKGSSMRVLERWKSFQGNKKYERFIKDKVLISLLKEIYCLDRDAEIYLDSFKSYETCINSLFSGVRRNMFQPLMRLKKELDIK